MSKGAEVISGLARFGGLFFAAMLNGGLVRPTFRCFDSSHWAADQNATYLGYLGDPVFNG